MITRLASTSRRLSPGQPPDKVSCRGVTHPNPGRSKPDHASWYHRITWKPRAHDLYRVCRSYPGAASSCVREKPSRQRIPFSKTGSSSGSRSRIQFRPRRAQSYPDFTLVKHTDGYELRGLAYPGRDANFDSNSQIPTGNHNGRNIYYVFGRYPQQPDGDSFPVIDLVMCHGDFLNADHEYKR